MDILVFKGRVELQVSLLIHFGCRFSFVSSSPQETLQHFKTRTHVQYYISPYKPPQSEVSASAVPSANDVLSMLRRGL